MNQSEAHHQNRSFVRRDGRMTRAQRRALEELWSRYGLPADAGMLDLDAVFGRPAPRILEIGFGNGDALTAMAAAHPENDYLGTDVHRPGIGSLLIKLDQQGIENVHLFDVDALDVLGVCLPDKSLDAVHLFFPDPWPKRCHHKRRIVQSEFVQLVKQKLKPGGRLHMATDWEDYARHMLGTMRAEPAFHNLAAPEDFLPRPDYRPVTKFEQRGQRLGHGVWDLIYEKLS